MKDLDEKIINLVFAIMVPIVIIMLVMVLVGVIGWIVVFVYTILGPIGLTAYLLVHGLVSYLLYKGVR